MKIISFKNGISTVRTITFFLAFMSLLFLVLSMFVEIDVGKWDTGVDLLCKFFVALGIINATGEVAPLTWKFLMEKLKSSVATPAFMSLLMFTLYDVLIPAEIILPQTALIILSTVRLIFYAIWGVGIGNNTNNIYDYTGPTPEIEVAEAWD